MNAPSAAKGALVKLYKVKADGSKVLVAEKIANEYGNARFIRFIKGNKNEKN